jgi:DNA modification methylase
VTTEYSIVNKDCLDVLRDTPTLHYDMLFADPPDNLGLAYNTYVDKIPDDQYYAQFEQWLSWSMHSAKVVWFSYYWKHDLEVKYITRSLLKYVYPTFSAKTFLWRFTFGQHNQRDCGNGFRYLLRLRHCGAQLYPGNILERSKRQELGDPRANPDGRVPDDVWSFPRVVGNASERRSWHPTQHPLSLLRRIILFSTKEKDKIIDIFGGTGTTLRVAKELGRSCTSVELDAGYCKKLATEMEI